MPAEWQRSRFKRIFRERDERSVAGDEMLLSVSAYTGVRPRAEMIESDEAISRAESLVGYKVCKRGDLAVNIMLAWNRGLGFSAYDGIVSPSYCVFECKDRSDLRFLDYLVRSDPYITYFKAYSAGVVDSRLRLYPDVFGSLTCVLPSLQEQQAISGFLDRETAAIDALIAEQQHLIDLLQEKRQAVISSAVTKGLSPNVPMKPSGVEWLGEVPAHWEVVPLRHLCEESVAGPYGASLTKSMYTSSGYKVYGQQQVIENDFSTGDYFISEEMYREMGRYVVYPGDLLVTVMGTVGQVAVVPNDAEPGIINPRLVRYKLIESLNPRFIRELLMSRGYQEHLRMASNGSTMDGLNMGSLGRVPVLVPPASEQGELTAFVSSVTRNGQSLIRDAKAAVSLLEERRSALITAAVTGQIDVRDAVVRSA